MGYSSSHSLLLLPQPRNSNWVYVIFLRRKEEDEEEGTRARTSTHRI